jgi:carbon storage regulator
MLVLTRKKGDSIVIGDNIVVMVVGIQGDKVRLGIEAPRDVAVNRREVYDAIKRSEGSLMKSPETLSSNE